MFLAAQCADFRSAHCRFGSYSGAEIHPDRFRLGEVLDRRRAVFAAKAGVALTAPRQPHIGIAVGVDPDGSGPRALGEALDPAHVAAPDACCKAIRDAIRSPQRVGFIPKLADAYLS